MNRLFWKWCKSIFFCFEEIKVYAKLSINYAMSRLFKKWTYFQNKRSKYVLACYVSENFSKLSEKNCKIRDLTGNFRTRWFTYFSNKRITYKKQVVSTFFIASFHAMYPLYIFVVIKSLKLFSRKKNCRIYTTIGRYKHKIRNCDFLPGWNNTFCSPPPISIDKV